MRRKLVILTRIVIYVVAFVVPPVLVSVVGMKSVDAERYEGPPDAAKGQIGNLPAPPAHDPGKPTAVVLLGNQGAEVTDVLAPYEVLTASGAFNVYAVAPERDVVTLSGGLDIVPHLSFAELDRRLGGGEPDVVVVPAMPDVGSAAHQPVAEWLRKHAAGTGTVMSVCDGAEVLADAGLLDGRRATTHWTAFDGWAKRYPKTEWVPGLRYVEDGNVVTAAGVTSGVAATLHVIRGYLGDQATTDLARKIGYPDQRLEDEPRIEVKHLTVSDKALYLLGAAYGWDRPRIGVVLDEGISEIELASVIDVYPGQVFTANITTLTPEGPRAPVRTAHGLYVIPRADLTGVSGLDRVLVPGRAAASVTDPKVRAWAGEHGLELEFVHAGGAARFPFDATLTDLAGHENAPVAEFTAKLLEYPTGHLALSGSGWPFSLLLQPFALGLLGLALVAFIDLILYLGERLGSGRARRLPPTRA